ncbi:hypothetical protein F4561_001778 [Lipingzhangella halophila]|uniref:Uncharacterized protein n=1 Tax=Lipingzhangella halophila TaxID=1783352 RepID=A0A7W7W227_9ACTN|nr:hypothetical protein [Lipingzhangella halophila]MBB4930958.1 hypothetical protein [Lipingzhangella halophila]
MTEYRASFNAYVAFSNGGNLSTNGFRIDVPSRDAGHDEIAELFIASLDLLMAESVELSDVRVFPEPHKGTRSGPSGHRRCSVCARTRD